MITTRRSDTSNQRGRAPQKLRIPIAFITAESGTDEGRVLPVAQIPTTPKISNDERRNDTP